MRHQIKASIPLSSSHNLTFNFYYQNLNYQYHAFTLKIPFYKTIKMDTAANKLGSIKRKMVSLLTSSVAIQEPNNAIQKTREQEATLHREPNRHINLPTYQG